MRLNIPRIALVDTGYWYALLDERDQHHSAAIAKSEQLLRLQYLIPWPVMYETLCTRFVRRPIAVQKFEAILKKANAVQVDDCRYRNSALAITLDTTKAHPNKISAVDSVLRLVLDDPSSRIDCMFTFNPSDFLDVCLRRNVQII